ncbi:hypothetical protein [Alteromonas lipolytica]|uniref:hypothetical protein n=1 Tax=Alteromonas lipolytica TaxID=1856405 RepID=UPI0011130AA4|nr:hypothetical protein [Alteromonas lipolytica]
MATSYYFWGNWRQTSAFVPTTRVQQAGNQEPAGRIIEAPASADPTQSILCRDSRPSNPKPE